MKQPPIRQKEYFGDYQSYDLEWAMTVEMSDYNIFRTIPYYMAMEFLEDTGFGVPYAKGKKFEGGAREIMILASAPLDKRHVLYNVREVKAVFYAAQKAPPTTGWMDSVIYYAAERVEKLCNMNRRHYQ